MTSTFSKLFMKKKNNKVDHNQLLNEKCINEVINSSSVHSTKSKPKTSKNTERSFITVTNLENISYPQYKRLNKTYCGDMEKNSDKKNCIMPSIFKHFEKKCKLKTNISKNFVYDFENSFSGSPSPLDLTHIDTYSSIPSNSFYEEDVLDDRTSFCEIDVTDECNKVLSLVKHYENEIKRWKRKLKSCKKWCTSKVTESKKETDYLNYIIETYKKKALEEEYKLINEINKSRNLQILLNDAYEYINHLEIQLERKNFPIEDNYTIPGAGEALCRITDSNIDILYNLSLKNKQKVSQNK